MVVVVRPVKKYDGRPAVAEIINLTPLLVVLLYSWTGQTFTTSPMQSTWLWPPMGKFSQDMITLKLPSLFINWFQKMLKWLHYILIGHCTSLSPTFIMLDKNNFVKCLITIFYIRRISRLFIIQKAMWTHCYVLSNM